MASEETKNCLRCRALFVVDAADFAFYEKMHVPAPGLCPECRFKRRAQFRNEMMLYSRTCGLCGRPIVAMYNPKSPYTVYCNACWGSDKWDPYAYGQAYDPDRPFFDQFRELSIRVPKRATYTTTGPGPNVNSEYTNVAGGNKNCYLIFNAGKNEDSMYSRGILGCRDTMDAYFGADMENCYETVNVNQSNGVVFGQNVTGSLDSLFMRDASGCQNCFGCVNLRHKQHHFFNESLPPEEWEQRVAQIRGSYQKMEEARQKFEEFVLRFPRRENANMKTERSVGDYLFESKNLQHCFEVTRGEDSKYLFSTKLVKDSYDLIGYGYNSELLLECVAVGYSTRVIGSYAVENSHDVEYSYDCTSSANCFGCDGLKHGEYSILNRRYPEAEYRALRAEIIQRLSAEGLYGLSVPPTAVPFAYNETIAQDNLPLTKEEALSQGFRWEDNLQMTVGKETMRPEQIPDHIKDAPDTITNEILVCIGCSRNYRIVPAELAFHRKIILPIPRKCFFCRHKDRIRRRGPFKLYDRSCAKCGKGIQTNYSPERPEIVYCGACYQRAVL